MYFYDFSAKDITLSAQYFFMSDIKRIELHILGETQHIDDALEVLLAFGRCAVVRVHIASEIELASALHSYAIGAEDLLHDLLGVTR